MQFLCAFFFAFQLSFSLNFFPQWADSSLRFHCLHRFPKVKYVHLNNNPCLSSSIRACSVSLCIFWITWHSCNFGRATTIIKLSTSRCIDTYPLLSLSLSLSLTHTHSLTHSLTLSLILNRSIHKSRNSLILLYYENHMFSSKVWNTSKSGAVFSYGSMVGISVYLLHDNLYVSCFFGTFCRNPALSLF